LRAAGRLLIAFWLLVLPAWADDGTPQALATTPLLVETAQGVHRLTVEVARTPAQRAIGLMYRTTMPPDHGMLFDLGVPRVVSMWMKNTFISLDMLFIQSDGRIANIVADTVPESLAPVRSRGRVLGVLELNAGTAAALGIRPGDLIRHGMFDNMPHAD